MAEDEAQNCEGRQSFKIHVPYEFASILFIATTIVVLVVTLTPNPTRPAEDGSVGSERRRCLVNEMENRLSFDKFEDGNNGHWNNEIVDDYAQAYTSFLSIVNNSPTLPYKAFGIPMGASRVFLIIQLLSA
jgi:hypothetical protein